MAKGAVRPPRGVTLPPMPKPPDPNKVVTQPPRLKPASTRNYGKGGTPLSGAPDMGLRGFGAGYGGPTDGV